jgi:antitoxin component YwqK of YwqJK toxin-antitoxin module
MSKGIRRLVFLGYFLVSTSAHAWDLEERFKPYRSGVSARHFRAGDTSADISMHPNGTAKLAVRRVKGQSNSITEVFLPSGVVQVSALALNGKVDEASRRFFGENGLPQATNKIEPFQTLDKTVEQLVRGIRANPTSRLLPVVESQASLSVENKNQGEFFFLNESDTPIMKATFENGVLEGPAAEVHISGESLSSFSYVSGMAHGEFKIFNDPQTAGSSFKQGTLREQGRYSFGMIDGEFTSHKDGAKLFTLNFREGKLEGPAILFFANGKVKESCTFRNNARFGPCQILDASGAKVAEVSHNGNKTSGELVQKLPSGTVKRSGTFDSQGRLTGIIETFNDKGRLLKKEILREGVLDGEIVHYHPNGQLKETAPYKMGKRDGITNLYFPSGKKRAEIPYKAGLKHGKYISYYETGQIYEVTNYALDKRVGTSEQHNKHGFRTGGTVGNQNIDYLGLRAAEERLKGQ